MGRGTDRSFGVVFEYVLEGGLSGVARYNVAIMYIISLT